MINNSYKITGITEIANGKLSINGKEEYDSSGNTFEKTLASIVSKYKVVHPRYGKMDRLAQLGYTCIEILLQNLDISIYKPHEVALLLSNNSSSLDTDYRFQTTTKDIASPALFVYTLPNIMLAEICIKNGFKGENMFFISDKYDEKAMNFLITEMLYNNRAQACISGWVEILNQEYRGLVFMVEKETKNKEFSIEFNLINIVNCFKIS